MRNSVKKLPLYFCITCIVLALICISCIMTNTYAVGDNDLKITTEGNTKVVSNIQNYLKSNTKTRSNSAYDKVDKILESLDVDNPEDFKVNSAFYDNCMNAKTIYATNSNIVGNEAYDNNELNFSFLIFDEGNLYNNLPTYTLYALAGWKSSYPFFRFTDTICFAYAGGNSLITGSDNTLYEMYYNRYNYLTGSSSFITKTKSELSEQSILPYFGVYYPMPSNYTIQNFSYSNFILFAQCQITATDDFVATSSYGHQTISVIPAASISTSGLSVGISFATSVEVYNPGIIRIDII